MSAYQYANNPATTLSGALTAGATSLSVASATGFPSQGKFPIIVDSEIMLVTGVSGTTWTVTRGAEDTTAAAHNNNSAVTAILTVDSFLNVASFDLRSFGAKSDGSTDDTTAFQAAIDAAEVNGGRVLVPAGNTKITSALTIDSDNVAIVGMGMGVSTITNSGTGNAFEVGGAVTSTKYVGFRDLSIIGNSDSADGFLLDGVFHVDFTRCEIKGHGTWGVEMDNTVAAANRITFYACRIHDNYPDDLTLGDGGGVNIGQQCEQIWFYGCSIRSVFDNKRSNHIGIDIHGFTNVVTVYGGDITTSGRGVRISGPDADTSTTDTIVLRGIYFEDNDYGVSVSSGAGAGYTRNVVIEDNSFSQSADYAIYVNNGRDVIIRNNMVRDSTAPFIGLESSAKNVKIGQNSVRGDATGSYLSVISGSPTYSYMDRYQQSKRVVGSSIASAATGDVTVTWDAPFDDANYTIAITVQQGTNPHLLQAGILGTPTTTGCTVRVKNNDSTARTPTIHAIAIHD